MKKNIGFYVYLIAYYIYIIGGYPYINTALKQFYDNTDFLRDGDYTMRITVLSYILLVATYFITGITLCFLVKLKKERRFICLELFIVDIPILLLVSCRLLFMFVPGLPAIIRYNSNFLTVVGSLLLSGEILRCVEGLKAKSE